VSSRTYLSIGDVLSLLRQEFPDVTISKIRFLESQGLVNPERSPSGYRKFYSHDVERLRWVLRQQREHFLPLKVIRDRLAGTDGVPSDDATDSDAHETSEAEIVSANGSGSLDGAPRVPEPAMAGAHRAPSPPAPREPQPAALARPVQEAAHSPRPEPQPVAAVAAPVVAAPVVTAPVVVAPASASPAAAAPVATAPATVVATATPPPVGDRRSEPEATRERSARPAPSERAATAPQVDGPGEAPGPPPTGSAGTSLTADELCNASGLSITEVAALEGFGLIEPVTVAGTLYYDEECLTVAKLVSDFARYGIEPRHLRLYRNAVDRELGLVEQIITPLLRQRNPEARKRAGDAAADLNRLGQQLRGALLRRGIRNQFGG
jgi:DNA-binding transcriptional MerR regulator